MNNQSSFPERLRHAVAASTGGVLGLVDELLAISAEYEGLQLSWQTSRCCVRALRNKPTSWIDVPLRKSVVRAALARIAVLCNERRPNSVSPYGGQGEVSVGPEPSTVLRVAFANTPDDQHLELVPVPSEGAVDRTTRPDRDSVRTGPSMEAEEHLG